MAGIARKPDDAAREIEERERRFRSFIWIVTEDGAHSFLTAMAETSTHGASLAGGLEDLPEPARLEAVQRRVREHHQETGEIGSDAILEYSIDWSKGLAGDQIETSAWLSAIHQDR